MGASWRVTRDPTFQHLTFFRHSSPATFPTYMTPCRDAPELWQDTGQGLRENGCVTFAGGSFEFCLWFNFLSVPQFNLYHWRPNGERDGSLIHLLMWPSTPLCYFFFQDCF